MDTLILFADYSESVLFLARIVVGLVMVYFGFPKVRDLRSNAKEFVNMGFKPGWFWGTIVAFVEFIGGVLLFFGVFVPVVASLFGIEMIGGTIWKITKAKKKFPDYSYDVLLFVLCLIFLAFGGGSL
jgi:uncharacterized membrane protein YphA (DoxX/SURF4 family)